MNEFLLVLGIAFLAAFLTYLGAPAAERFEVSTRLVSAALQFAAGIITAMVAFSLMPPALRDGPAVTGVLAFFLGGALFVLLEYLSARLIQARSANQDNPTSLGLYIGILVDLLVDGVVIGIGATLTIATGLLLALGLALSTFPLAFVTTATARKQGVSPKDRRLLSYLFVVCILAGALLGFAFLQDQPEAARLTLIALSAGFLITTVTQSIIPEANREGEPGFAGLLYIGGLSLYGLMSLTIK